MNESKPGDFHQLIGIGASGVILLLGNWYSKHKLQISRIVSYFDGKVVPILVAIGLFVLVMSFVWLWNKYVKFANERAITEKDATSIPLGTDEKGKEVHLKQAFRTSHAQIIGTTNAGKTESIILPWAIKDIENGSGLLIIDGKSDTGRVSFLLSEHARHRQM